MRTCEYEDCDRKHLSKGLCSLHYQRRARGIPMNAPPLRNPKRGCSVNLCRNKHKAKGLCVFHYNRLLKGKRVDAPRRVVHQPRVDNMGYVRIFKKGHPNAWERGHIFEHTYIMSEHLGRPMFPGETIHHKNGIRDDNRIENLELRASAHGVGQTIPDLVAHAEQILARYPEYRIQYT